MAFTTRTGRTVAIGHGTMLTALWIWTVTFLLVLWAPILTGILVFAWHLPNTEKKSIELLIGSAWGLAILCLATAVMFRTLVVMGAMTLFAGPDNRLIDQLAAVFQARSARWLAAGAVLLAALMFVMRSDFGSAKLPLYFTLSLAAIVLDVLSIRGLWRIMKSNRKIPHFEGLTEAQKRKIDRPWMTRVRPTFPADDAYVSPSDARRYARRANDNAQILEWIGGGVIIVFSAFVGTVIPAIWESKDPFSQIPMFLVLGFVALGFWMQSQARAYVRLADSFERPERTRRRRTVIARARHLRASSTRGGRPGIRR